MSNYRPYSMATNRMLKEPGCADHKHDGIGAEVRQFNLSVRQMNPPDLQGQCHIIQKKIRGYARATCPSSEYGPQNFTMTSP